MKFFVGDYTRLGGPGVALCELDGETMRLLETYPGLENPTYLILSADQKTLYATSTTPADGEEGNSVAAFDVSEGHLTYVCRQSTAGLSACHLTLSPDERFLYVANYSTGSVAVFPVCGNQIAPRIQLIEHEGTGPNADRQERAHTHFVAFDPEDDTLLYAVDLGIDAVMIYRQDPETGLLALCQRVDVPAGMGPRHLVFGKDMMYVAHELGNAVSVFHRENSGWSLVQNISTLPEEWEGESYVAAIRLTGNRVFVSNRGHDSLAVYRVLIDGTLSLVGIYSTIGQWPRDFIHLPDGRILAAHQESGDVSLFEYEEENLDLINDVTRTRRIMLDRLNSNGLAMIAEPLSLPGAVCVCPMTR